MREYKFRGKHYYLTGVWVYGDLVRHACAPGYVFIGTKNDGTIQVIPETVGQFTGLHDKNGVEIYEGDIVRARSGVSWTNGKEETFYKIRTVEWVGLHYRPFIQTSEYPNDWAGLGAWEVIGNIHENPELLEGK